MADATDDPKRYCLQLVQTHLSTGWKNAQINDLVFKRVFGGCTSLLFYLKAINCQPEELIVRFHYANDDETNVYDLKFSGEAGETLIFHILSEHKNFGPKLYSVFHGGRIEEYIPSIQLPDQDVIDGLYHKTILKKIAYVHTLEIPIVKDDKWISRFYENYEQVLNNLQTNRNQIIDQHNDDQVKEMQGKMLDFDLINELFWFKENLTKLQCRLVFSHNDITKRNILVRTDLDESNTVEERIVLIDFGDAAYNYRGLDLADYLRCRVSIKRVIKDGEEIEFYTDEEIDQFCTWYLSEFEECSKKFDSSIDNLDSLLKEVSYFLLLSDLMTILYLTLSTQKSDGHKENWIYAIKRIALYKQSKMKFFRKYGHQVDFKETLSKRTYSSSECELSDCVEEILI